MYRLIVLVVLLSALGLSVGSGRFAQQQDTSHEPSIHRHDAPVVAGQWDGSPEGKAYSERNHQLAGVLVLVIGLSELYGGVSRTKPAWSRILLPFALLSAGGFLMIWSDHDAWPIGSRTFTQTFFGDDFETVQHKLYAILFLGVGMIELLWRTDRVMHGAWSVPLPALALIAGLMLFFHSHGAHPSAHQIAIHHAVMGTTALLAGVCKITAGAKRQEGRSPWALAWAALVFLIGIELLVYKE